MNTEGQCWLIDFYRTYPSHILRDFVVLETDLKFRLMPALSPEAFCELETALLGPQPPADAVSLGPAASPGAQKAAQVIAGLRAEAWALLGGQTPRQIRREYLMSLLMATLNILRLRQFKSNAALEPRRELALLSAALICQHLEHPSG
jgi:hypothetical protein